MQTLGTMEVCLSLHSNIAFNSLVVYVQQEGVPSNMLPLQAQQREKSQEPEKLVSLEQPETSPSLLPSSLPNASISTSLIYLHVTRFISPTSSPLPPLPPLQPPPGKKGRALFAFEGQSEKELSFQKSAIIDLLHTVNENWLEGMIGQMKGIFPSSYIQV